MATEAGCGGLAVAASEELSEKGGLEGTKSRQSKELVGAIRLHTPKQGFSDKLRGGIQHY